MPSYRKNLVATSDGELSDRPDLPTQEDLDFIDDSTPPSSPSKGWKQKVVADSSPSKKLAVSPRKRKSIKSAEIIELDTSDDDRIVPLDPDDKMYPEKSPSRVKGGKTLPPLKTRSASSAMQKRALETTNSDDGLSDESRLRTSPKKSRIFTKLPESGDDSDNVPAVASVPSTPRKPQKVTSLQRVEEPPLTPSPTKPSGKAKPKSSNPFVDASAEEDDNENPGLRDSRSSSDEEESFIDKSAAVRVSKQVSKSRARNLGKQPATVDSADSDDGVTFGDVFGVKRNTKDKKSQPAAKTLDDLTRRRVLELPSECQVTKTEAVDPRIADTYKGLPNLLVGIFESWDNRQGLNPIMWSTWGKQCPDMKYKRALAALTFVHHDYYVNPSRVSPLLLSAKDISGDGLKFLIQVEQQTPNGVTTYHNAIGLSCIFVTEFNLLTPKVSAGGKRQKDIRGVMHSCDMGRFCGTVCMVFHEPVMGAQYSRGSFAFQTKMEGARTNADFGGYGKSSHDTQEGMHSNVASPHVRPAKATSSASRSFIKTVLDFEEDVPVYDGRKKSINYNGDLDNISTHLPIFSDVVPFGSFAVVAYTMSSYPGKNGAPPGLNLNVKWVIVVGTPE